MRKCITGHVGDASFKEVLKLIEAGPPRSTLFVVNGPSEKVIHFSEERVILLELPRSEPHSGPVAGAEDVEASRAKLRKALQELSSWSGALFEHREGQAGPALESHPTAMKLAGSLSKVVAGLKGSAEASSGKTPAGEGTSVDRLARAEEILKLIPQAFSKHLLYRELAQIWKGLGSGRRAAACLRDVARHYAEWGAAENACEVLEQATELCPADLGAVGDLIALAQSAGRQKQAEHAAETVCAVLDKLRLHERIVEVYRLLERAPESTSLRRLNAEALIKTGDLVQGLRELTAAATFLESRGDEEGAIRVYERIAEVDPTSTEARERVRKARRQQVVSSRLRRSATLIAATLLFVLWFTWDVSSASAFQRLKTEEMSREPRAAVELLRQGAGSFPGTRYAGRLAGLEEDLYRQSFDADSRRILNAVAVLESGDLDMASKLFGQVAEKALIAPLRDRARAGRDEIEKKRTRVDGLVEQAARLVKARDLPKAFGVYREMLLGSRDEVLASSYSVPVLIDTVPQGAAIRVDGQNVGRAPRWVFLPSDPACRLALGSPGFSPVEIVDPLAPLLERNESRLRVALAPDAVWRLNSAGGELAENLGSDPQTLVSFGADGVLRAFDAHGARRWETPLEAGVRLGCPPLTTGPAVLVGTDQGQVLAFSLASGKLAWATRLGVKGGSVRLGPVYAGQVVASSGAGSVLLNPQTGLVCRKVGIAIKSPVRFQAVAGGLGVFALENGDFLGADLATGLPAFAREGILSDSSWIVVDGTTMISGGKGGRMKACSLPGCEDLWETALQGELKAACLAEDGRVCVASLTGVVVCLDSRTGQPAWKTSVEGSVTALSGASRDASGCIVARMTRNGGTVLAAVSSAAGKVLWELDAGPGDAASVRLERSRVVVSAPSLGVMVLKAPAP